MKRRRVKITGIGPVTPAGTGREFWAGINKPISRVSRLSRFSEEAGAFVGAEVREFRLDAFLSPVFDKRLPRHTQFALAGAILALADAKLSLAAVRANSPAVIIGASLMDFGAINKGIEAIIKKGLINGFPRAVFSASVSAIAGTIAEYIGGTTRALAVQSACCAGVDAIGQAADLVAAGEVGVAICGGTEAPLFLHPMLELRMAGLSPANIDSPERQCRPFDLWRTTGVIGEGSCVLVLEPEDSPRQAYAFIEGYAYASDPIGKPGVGLVAAIRLALANARVRDESVDCISAWGPGHRVIDSAEAAALKEVFGSRLKEIPAVSLKGAIGNPLGAAGAIQTGCAALGLAHGMIPPTVNWVQPDPECPLNLSSRTRSVAHGVVLVNSHGLSGTNACLVLKQ